MSTTWIRPEQAPNGHNPSLEVFARLLRPEVYELEQEAHAVLASARKLLEEPGTDAKKAEALRRKAALEAELAALNATLEK